MYTNEIHEMPYCENIDLEGEINEEERTRYFYASGFSEEAVRNRLLGQTFDGFLHPTN